MSIELRQRILEACYRFLTPVARFLLRSGISYSEFEEVAKCAFVRVASSEYGIRRRRTNLSRVSAMTGIPRKEVKRIRDEPDRETETPWKRLGPPGNVLHGWFTDPRFQRDKGTPAALPFEAADVESFSGLARRYAGDIPPGALRSELLRLGAIEELENGELKVLQRHVVPPAFDEKLLTSISFNLSGLAETIAFNSNPQRSTEGRIERFVINDTIPRALQVELRRELRKRIETFAESVDDLFGENEGPQTEPGPVLGVGVYYYESDSPEPTE